MCIEFLLECTAMLKILDKLIVILLLPIPQFHSKETEISGSNG